MPEPTLTENERLSLHVLAWLFLRMGFMERAERIYAALAGDAEPDGLASAGLAAARLSRPGSDAVEALRLLDTARAEGLPENAGIILMRAQALWRAGRADEARAEMEKFRRLSGEQGV